MVSTQWRITVHNQTGVVGCYNSKKKIVINYYKHDFDFGNQNYLLEFNSNSVTFSFTNIVWNSFIYQYSWRIQTNKVTIIPIQWKYFYLWRKNIVIDNILSIKKNCYVYTILTVFYPKIICNQNKTINYWCTFIWTNYILR